jgi:hypothetical protein
LVAVVLEFVAALLTLFTSLVPGFAAVVNSILPLVVTILRSIAPVRTLLGACALAFAAASIYRQLTRTISGRVAKCSAESRTRAGSRRRAEKVTRTF